MPGQVVTHIIDVRTLKNKPHIVNRWENPITEDGIDCSTFFCPPTYKKLNRKAKQTPEIDIKDLDKPEGHYTLATDEYFVLYGYDNKQALALSRDWESIVLCRRQILSDVQTAKNENALQPNVDQNADESSSLLKTSPC